LTIENCEGETVTACCTVLGEVISYKAEIKIGAKAYTKIAFAANAITYGICAAIP